MPQTNDLVITMPVRFLQAAAPEEGGTPKIPRFEIDAYDGGLMDIEGFDKPVIIRLSGLMPKDKKIPILRDHDRGQVVGHTDSVTISTTNVKATGVISGAGPAAQEITASAGNDFPWEASVGVKIRAVSNLRGRRTEVVNGREVTGPATIVEDGVLREISFTAIGASESTSATIAAMSALNAKDGNMTFEEFVKGLDLDVADVMKNEPLTKILMEQYTATGSEPVGESPVEDEPAEAAEGDVEPPVEEEEKEDEPAEAGAVVDLKAFEALRAKVADMEKLGTVRASRKTAPKPSRRNVQNPKVIEAALALTSGCAQEFIGKQYGEEVTNKAIEAQHAGISLEQVCRDVVEAAGNTWPGRRSPSAFKVLEASSSPSYGSISGILSNVANKALLESFMAVPAVSTMLAEEQTTSDFKQFSRYRLTATDDLETVGPGGEIELGGLTDETYTNQLITKAKRITLTRQDLINDDLGAFNQMAKLLGRSAAITREKMFFQLLLANTGSFFASGNSNLLPSGDTEALSVAALSDARTLFRQQTDSAGNNILAQPKYLVVPPELEDTAFRLVSSEMLLEASTAGSPTGEKNPHFGKLELVVADMLSNTSIHSSASATAWYLFAAPTELPAFAIGYLNNKKTPTVEQSDADFTTLGVQYRVYWDLGVAQVDYRGAVMSDGAD